MRIFQYMRRFFQMMARMRKVIHIVSMTCRHEQRKNGLVPVESYKRETDRNLWIRSIGPIIPHGTASFFLQLDDGIAAALWTSRSE